MTDKQLRTLLLFVTVLLLAIVGLDAYRLNIQHKETIEAIKSGYSQKWDEQARKMIWVKP